MAQVVEQLLTKHKFRHQYCQKKKEKRKKNVLGSIWFVLPWVTGMEWFGQVSEITGT
jgi:hypothetical protein